MMDTIKHPRRHWTAWLVVAITFWGALLRFYGLHLPSLWIDEGFTIVRSRAVLEHGYPLLYDGAASWSSFLNYYVTAVFLKLIPDMELGARFYPALCGTLSLLSMYGLSSKITGSRWVGIVSMLLLASMTYEVAWSRQARMYAPLQFYMLTSILLFYHFYDSRRPWQILAAIVLAMMAAYTQKAGVLVLLIAGLGFAFHLVRYREWIGWLLDHRKTTLGIFLLLVLFLASMIALSMKGTAIVAFEDLGKDQHAMYARKYAAFLLDELGYIIVWIGVGALVGVVRYTRHVLPIVVFAALYFYFINTQSILFHYRYMLPLIAFLPLFAALALQAATILATYASESHLVKTIVVLLFLGSMGTGHFTIMPTTSYDLGFTAPTPNWEKAYAWIVRDHQRSGRPLDDIITVSTFPMFHDLYIGKGTKYFLPFSLSGYPTHIRDIPRYSDAELLRDTSDLKGLSGYVVLDSFGMKMLALPDLYRLLRAEPPSHVVERNDNKVFIWRLLPGPPAEPARPEH